LQVNIRCLTSADVAEAAGLFPENPAAEVEARLRDELAAQEQGRGFTFLAVADGAIAGAANLAWHELLGWIHNVAVLPQCRQQGIAQLLLERILAEARDRGLERLALHVRRDNIAAIRAYERAGFTFTGEDGTRGEQLRYEKRLSE
jgi:ribosomal protein S18 acetylase RimI-like enzyme